MDIVDPAGKPVLKIPVVKLGDYEFPLRIINPKTMFQNSPQEVVQGVLIQQGDLNNMFWYGLTALAKDIYSRQPEGSRHFAEFVKALGVKLTDLNGKEILLESEIA